MLLWEMTSPEIDALPRDIVVLIPVASCEQHSLHLPVWTDSFIGQEVARRVHEKISEDVLVLPVQWLGYSQHHIRYPGTVSAVSPTHLDLMMDMVDSMVGNGFRKILLQNSHGGNGAGIQVLLQRLMEKYQEGEAEFYTRWAWGTPDRLNEIRELANAGSGHAGETETSMMLAIRPELVRMNKLHKDGERAGMRAQGMSSYHRFDQRTEHGGVGDPTVGTAEKGQALLEASAEEVAQGVLELRRLRPLG
ncbi:MAG: creatininase family protein [Candidatus Latescibacterota bacterium]|nr:creatininase family protein [Candidatus Latescibacterota bacterium]